MDLCSPLPDLSLSVSRTGEALFTHYEKFFGILREFNHETNFEFPSNQNICPSLCLLNYQPETLPNEEKAKQECTQLFNFEYKYLQNIF